MSRGYGRVQCGCLTAITAYEGKRKQPPTTFEIAARVYRVKRGDSITAAQHVAVKRALEGLQRQGKVIGARSGAERAYRWRAKEDSGALNWGAVCNLDRGGTDNAPNDFIADCGKGQYLIDVRIRRTRDTIDLSRPRFRARWLVDRSLIEDDRTPHSNLIALGTYATAQEARATCEQHAKQATGSNSKTRQRQR